MQSQAVERLQDRTPMGHEHRTRRRYLQAAMIAHEKAPAEQLFDVSSSTISWARWFAD